MHNLFDNSGPILLQKCYSISDEELDLIMDIVSIIIDCFLIDNFLLEEHEDNAVLRVVIARKFNLNPILSNVKEDLKYYHVDLGDKELDFITMEEDTYIAHLNVNQTLPSLSEKLLARLSAIISDSVGRDIYIGQHNDGGLVAIDLLYCNTLNNN